MAFVVAIAVIFAISAIDVNASTSPVHSGSYATIYYQRPEALVYQNTVPQPFGAQFLLPLKQEPIIDAKDNNKTRGGTEATNITSTTTETPKTKEITTEAESKQINVSKTSDAEKKDNEKLTQRSDVANVKDQGVYYIYHPNGLLQKVAYSAQDDAKNMAFTAQLKYQNVQPINGPIYTYDPNTLVFQKVQIQE